MVLGGYPETGFYMCAVRIARFARIYMSRSGRSHICGANINAVLCIYQRCIFRPPTPPGVSSGLYKQINTINVTCIFHLRIIVHQAYT